MKDVALITGASSGIGKELAKIHASKGGDLILIARSEDKLKALKTEIESSHSVEVMLIVKDLSIESSAKEVYDQVKAEGIEVEYLINNAGFGGQGKFHERNWNEDLSMIRVNTIALSNFTHLFLTDFIYRNSGRILNVSSTASLLPGPLQATYFATKAFVTSLSNALTEELRGTNITVTALLPGATDTRFAEIAEMESAKLFSKMATARSVAVKGYDGMMKGKMNVLAGLTFSLRIMKTFRAFIPTKVLMKVVRNMQEL